MPKSKLKNERIAIYFDCICGVTSSVISLVGIVFAVLNYGIYDIGWFYISLTFWIGYLILSIFLISLGIYGYYKQKDYSAEKYKKKLKAPMVS
jgi:hypothetical protein